uniref:Uncharacterized protein n=1 Tax=Oryza brachyantha TaxID=4533 RepID=J3MT74_ORYBR
MTSRLEQLVVHAIHSFFSGHASLLGISAASVDKQIAKDTPHGQHHTGMDPACHLPSPFSCCFFLWDLWEGGSIQMNFNAPDLRFTAVARSPPPPPPAPVAIEMATCGLACVPIRDLSVTVRHGQFRLVTLTKEEEEK